MAVRLMHGMYKNKSLLEEIQKYIIKINHFASEKRDTSVQFYDDIYQKTILKYVAINCQW